MSPLLPAAVAGAYLVGAIPFGVIVGRLFGGVDVRESGSGNIGATNVARTAGKGWGIATLVLDAAKGAGPAFGMSVLAAAEPHAAWWTAGAGLAAFLGHCYSPYLRFGGGKGVATAFGVFLVLAPIAAGVGFVVYAVLFAAFRVSSVGSLAAAVVVPTAVFFTAPREYGALALVMVAVIVWKHRGNIQRLLARTEGKV